MKKLLPILLLLVAVPVWGATALEVWTGSSTSEVTVTADTWTTHGSALTVDRSGEGDTIEAFVIAHMAASADNAAAQGQFRLIQNISGTHDAATSTTVLTDSGAAFPTATGGLVGYTIFNDTDDSICIATANDATTITCAHGLETGTDNDWDSGDAYTIAVGSPGINSGNFDQGVRDEGSGDSDGTGFGPMTVIRRVTLGPSSHTFTWQGTNALAANTVMLKESSIVVIERSANAEYTDSYTAENFDPADNKISSSTFADHLALSFTATAEVWIVLFSFEFNSEDENDAQCQGFRFVRETTHDTIDTTYMSPGSCIAISSVNNGKFYGAAGVGFETLTAATHRFAIEWNGGGAAADETEVSRAAIIAFPASDFENVYTDSQTSPTTHAATYSDTLADIASQSVTTGETHIILAGAEVSNEIATERGSVKIVADGDSLMARNTDVRDSDNSDYHAQFLVYGKELASSPVTFVVQGLSSSADAAEEAVTNRVYLVVLEVPSGAAPAARRRVSVTIGAP